MKILPLLESKTEYGLLTDAETTVLRLVCTGKMVYDETRMRPETMDAFQRLAALGLLDSIAFEPTPRGLALARVAKRHGSHESREIQRRSATPFEKDRKYSNNGDTHDIASSDDVAGMGAGARGIDRGHIISQ